MILLSFFSWFSDKTILHTTELEKMSVGSMWCWDVDRERVLATYLHNEELQVRSKLPMSLDVSINPVLIWPSWYKWVLAYYVSLATRWWYSLIWTISGVNQWPLDCKDSTLTTAPQQLSLDVTLITNLCCALLCWQWWHMYKPSLITFNHVPIPLGSVLVQWSYFSLVQSFPGEELGRPIFSPPHTRNICLLKQLFWKSG